MTLGIRPYAQCQNLQKQMGERDAARRLYQGFIEGYTLARWVAHVHVACQVLIGQARKLTCLRSIISLVSSHRGAQIMSQLVLVVVNIRSATVSLATSWSSIIAPEAYRCASSLPACSHINGESVYWLEGCRGVRVKISGQVIAKPCGASRVARA